MAPGKRAGRHRGDCKAQRDECRGVVEQAFTLQNRYDATRNAQPLSNCGGGYGVGRRDNCAKDETSSQREIVDEMMSEKTDRSSSEKHETHCEQRKGPEIGAEIPPGGEECRGIEQRR